MRYRYWPRFVAFVAYVAFATRVAKSDFFASVLFSTGTMPKKGDRSILYVRKLPPGLLGRINARAEELEMERDAFVIQMLQRILRRFEEDQKKTQEWWEAELKEESRHDVLDSDHENGQEPIRRGSSPDASEASKEDHKNKSKAKKS